MRFQVQIHDVTPERLPDVIDAFGTVDVTTHGAGAGRYNVTPRWIENDPHWLLMCVETLERRLNADKHALHRVWVDKTQRDLDCTEGESADIKRYFDNHIPGHDQLATRLSEAFPTEWAEWGEEKEAKAR